MDKKTNELIAGLGAIGVGATLLAPNPICLFPWWTWTACFATGFLILTYNLISRLRAKLFLPKIIENSPNMFYQKDENPLPLFKRYLGTKIASLEYLMKRMSENEGKFVAVAKKSVEEIDEYFKTVESPTWQEYFDTRETVGKMLVYALSDTNKHFKESPDISTLADYTVNPLLVRKLKEDLNHLKQLEKDTSTIDLNPGVTSRAISEHLN